MRDAQIYSQGNAMHYTAGSSRGHSDKEMRKRLDLIFCSVNRNKSNMDFEHFLQSLVKVAEAKFTNLDPSQGLKTLIDHHLMPLA